MKDFTKILEFQLQECINVYVYSVKWNDDLFVPKPNSKIFKFTTDDTKFPVNILYGI